MVLVEKDRQRHDREHDQQIEKVVPLAENPPHAGGDAEAGGGQDRDRAGRQQGGDAGLRFDAEQHDHIGRHPDGDGDPREQGSDLAARAHRPIPAR